MPCEGGGGIRPSPALVLLQKHRRNHSFCLYFNPLGRAYGLAWNFLTLSMVVSGTYPVGAHQDVRVGIFQISKDTDATETEIAGSVPGSVFYSVFLSNISGGNILRLTRRAKFLAILAPYAGVHLYPR